MTIDIIGLGPSVAEYRPTGELSIGVNDAWKYVKTDILIVLDRPDRFNDERLHVIRNSRPKAFVTDLDLWEDMPNFTPIKLDERGANLEHLDNPDIYQRHVDTTYTAACCAFKMGASRIVMWGCDFEAHPELDHYWKDSTIPGAYKILFNELSKRNCKLTVGSFNSPLSKVLPVNLL